MLIWDSMILSEACLCLASSTFCPVLNPSVQSNAQDFLSTETQSITFFVNWYKIASWPFLGMAWFTNSFLRSILLKTPTRSGIMSSWISLSIALLMRLWPGALPNSQFKIYSCFNLSCGKRAVKFYVLWLICHNLRCHYFCLVYRFRLFSIKIVKKAE